MFITSNWKDFYHTLTNLSGVVGLCVQHCSKSLLEQKQNVQFKTVIKMDMNLDSSVPGTHDGHKGQGSKNNTQMDMEMCRLKG